MYKKDVIKKLIYEIYLVNNNAIEIHSNKDKKRFELSYELSKKYATVIGTDYFFGIDLDSVDDKSYLKVFKELLRIKRFLKTQ